jgi:hypothetical protein
MSRSRRGGQLYLLLSLPDQSRSLIPASWTDLRARAELAPGNGTAPPQPLLATLEDLLKARNVIDTMLSRKTDAKELDDTAQPDRDRSACPGSSGVGAVRPNSSRGAHKAPRSRHRQGGLHTSDCGGQE